MDADFASLWESKKQIAAIIADDVSQSTPARAEDIAVILREFTSLPTPRNRDEFLRRSRTFISLNFELDSIAAEERRSARGSH